MFEKLSLENKRMLLDLITEKCINYNSQKIELGLMFDPDSYVNNEEKYGIISFYMSKFIDNYKKEIKIQYEKVLEQAKKDVSDFYFKQVTFQNSLLNYVLIKEKSKLWATIIEHVTRAIDPETINVFLNITNYKPCHNIRLLSKDKLFDVQIRSNDIVIYGENCYGRNVNVIKTSIITDNTLESAFKKINLKQ